jgi:hypothetical protein
MKNKPDWAIMIVYYSTPTILLSIFNLAIALHESHTYFMSHKIMLTAIKNSNYVAILEPTKRQ